MSDSIRYETIPLGIDLHGTDYIVVSKILAAWSFTKMIGKTPLSYILKENMQMNFPTVKVLFNVFWVCFIYLKFVFNLF